MITHGSLCSGYDGIGLALEAELDARLAYVCDFDKAPGLVLAHHYPEVPNQRDEGRPRGILRPAIDCNVLPVDGTWLYHLSSRAEDLLYVGITWNLVQRLRRHKALKPWWSDVFRCPTCPPIYNIDVPRAYQPKAAWLEAPDLGYLDFFASAV